MRTNRIWELLVFGDCDALIELGERVQGRARYSLSIVVLQTDEFAYWAICVRCVNARFILTRLKDSLVRRFGRFSFRN